MPSGARAIGTYVAQFDPLFKTLAQRQGFRAYLSGLLLPRERPKILTALADAEPLVQAQAAEVQQLQFFLSEAAWDAGTINARSLALLLSNSSIFAVKPDRQRCRS